MDLKSLTAALGLLPFAALALPARRRLVLPPSDRGSRLEVLDRVAESWWLLEIQLMLLWKEPQRIDYRPPLLRAHGLEKRSTPLLAPLPSLRPAWLGARIEEVRKEVHQQIRLPLIDQDCSEEDWKKEVDRGGREEGKEIVPDLGPGLPTAVVTKQFEGFVQVVSPVLPSEHCGDRVALVTTMRSQIGVLGSRDTGKGELDAPQSAKLLFGQVRHLLRHPPARS